MKFQHKQSAHCESGVMASLISHHGIEISEPMAFGLGNGLAFAYIPFIKISGQPLIAYRLPPRAIIRSLSKRLDIKMQFKKFRKPYDGVIALQQAIDQGKLVGLQTSVFWLPYFPEEMRFHFNAHNLLVYSRENNTYKISDPVFEEAVEVEQVHLTKARFAKGPLAPKGLMYTIEKMPPKIDYEKVIPQAIGKNIKIMTGAPLPLIGIRGIRYIAKKISLLNKKLSHEEQRLYLGHIVRMQEEIGTGGAGFRFMYASFLEEAGNKLADDTLKQASNAMTEAGDQWRLFALKTVQRGKSKNNISLEQLTEQLHRCADLEEDVWKQLKSWLKSR